MVNGPEFRQTTSCVHGGAGCAGGLPRGRSFCSLPKAKIFCRSNGCSLSGFSPASVSEGFQRASGKPFGAPAGAYPCWGLTRRLRRGSRAYSPMGRSHFSFGGERKVCKRKPAARRLREKGFYCPFWRRGSLCRAQHDWPDFTCDPARSELAFFRRQNGRAFFPPLPIAALAPRGRRRAYLTLAG